MRPTHHRCRCGTMNSTSCGEVVKCLTRSLRLFLTVLVLGLGSCSTTLASQFEEARFLNATVAIVIATPTGPYGGTGFLLRVRDRFQIRSKTYLVTARHVVETGFCSNQESYPSEISLQLQHSGPQGDGRFQLVPVSLFFKGGRIWKAPKDEMIDLAIVPLPRTLLKGYRESPLGMRAIATRKLCSRLNSVGSPVELIGLDSRLPFRAEQKTLNKTLGVISSTPTQPILWTATCTKPMHNILLDIAIAPGNSGSPVIYRSSRISSPMSNKLGPVVGIISSGDPSKSLAGIVSADKLSELLEAR
jgi:hypothetical protein